MTTPATTWGRKRLADVADLCLGKMLDQNKNRGEYLPYLANVNVRWGSFDLSGLREMRFESHETGRYGLRYGDIVMCEGGEPGRCAIWKDEQPGMMIQKALHRIRARAGLDNRFLYYSLLHKGRTGGFAPLFTGATIKHLPGQNLAKIEVALPPLPVQERVADALSAYDDLIENNRRRIRLLEQSARLLYEEWFVHFRFPGHENVRITNGVPDGWKYRTVGEESNLKRGLSYRSTELVESGGKPFVNLKCIARHGGFRLDGLKKFAGEHKDGQIVSAGDIVVALTDMTRERYVVAHAARVPAAMGGDAVFSMDTVKVTPAATINKSWFYYFLRYSRFSMAVRELATGTNVLHLKPKQIAEYGFRCPPRPLQEHFDEITSHVLSQQDNLEVQNCELMQARDLLLPRLMNGEITA